MRPEKHQKIRRHQKNKHGKSGHGSTTGSKQKSVDTTEKSGNRSRHMPPEDNRLPRPNLGLGIRPSNETGSAGSSSNDRSESGSPGESQSTFSRRKIESNWSRYGDIEDLENEKVTQRGADLGLLLTKEDDSSAQFRFQDEQDWQDDVYQHQEGSVNVLTLNVQSLASQLQSLPISQRLNIDEDIFSIFEKDFGISNISNSRGILPKKGIKMDTSQEPNISPLPVENKNQTVPFIKPNLDSSKETSLKQTLKFSLHSQLSDKKHSGWELEPGRTSANRTNPVETQHVNYATANVNVQDKTEEDDDELDFLLALDNPIKTQQRKPDKHENDDQDIETELKQSKETSQGMLSQTKQTDFPCKENTDEGNLEDWLDSILDD